MYRRLAGRRRLGQGIIITIVAVGVVGAVVVHVFGEHISGHQNVMLRPRWNDWARPTFVRVVGMESVNGDDEWCAFVDPVGAAADTVQDGADDLDDAPRPSPVNAHLLRV